MTFYAIKAYLKYRIKAKGRHGIHSPFVYKLVDECLLVCNGRSLEEKLRMYFAAETLLWLDDAPLRTQVSATTGVSNKIFVVPGIHNSHAHTSDWNQLVADPGIKTSIDLFHFGLLVSKDEFKEKQHFILKYC
jgi:hypothetical protein